MSLSKDCSICKVNPMLCSAVHEDNLFINQEFSMNENELKMRVEKFASDNLPPMVLEGEFMHELLKLVQEQAKMEYKRGFSHGQDSMLYNGQIELVTIEDARKMAQEYADAIIDTTKTIYIKKDLTSLLSTDDYVKLREELREEQREENKKRGGKI